MVYHVISERGLYRPGEVVHVKGWVRKIKKNGDLKKIGGMRSQCLVSRVVCRKRAGACLHNQCADGHSNEQEW